MRLCAGVAAVILVADVCMAADWPQWRGPGRDGIVPGDDKIAATWPTAGPTETEKVTSHIPASPPSPALSAPVLLSALPDPGWRHSDPA